MLDMNPLIVTELKKIGLPVISENFISPATVFPCISYMEYSNIDTLTGDTLEYSELITMVKVWDKSLKVLIDNAKLVNAKMTGLGYKRDFGSPLFADGMGSYILRYKGLGFETK